MIVTVQDENDNSPVFERELYALSVSEEATNQTEIGIVAATDRDSGLYGQKGFKYELLYGDQRVNETLFNVDSSTGQIFVSDCPTPGRSPCLDYEARSAYFLILRVTDDEGRGNSALVPLRIDLRDVNDNPPVFEQLVFHTTIDEGATKFDPPFKVRARDEDSVSVLTYTIIDSDQSNMFLLDAKSGEVRVTKPIEVNSSQLATEEFNLNVQASPCLVLNLFFLRQGVSIRNRTTSPLHVTHSSISVGVRWNQPRHGPAKNCHS